MSYGLWFFLKARNEFNSLIEGIPDNLRVYKETDRLQKFRQEAEKGLWQVRSQEYYGYEKLLRNLGISADMDGIIQYYTHEMHSFDWTNMKRNEKTATIALLRSQYITDDGIIHRTADGNFIAIFYNANVVIFYKGTEKGILSGYITRKIEESNDATDLSTYELPQF